MMRFPFLVCVSPPPPLSLLPVLRLPQFLTAMMNFLFSGRTALLSYYGDAAVPLPRPVFLAFPPPPSLLLLALNLPRRLSAAADALLGMVDTDLHLLRNTLLWK
jgi:hypothetical protein